METGGSDYMSEIKKLTEKDILEGKSIADLFTTLSDESKNQCLIYIMALRDKELLSSSTSPKNQRG
jgi:hypothetical protein